MNNKPILRQFYSRGVKSKILFTFLLVVCFSLISTERCFAFAYAITSDDGTTVTFFNDTYFYTKWNNASYDSKKPRILIDDPSYSTLGPQYQGLAFGSSMNGKYWRYENVKKVVFDASFDSYTALTSCKNWFYEFTNLTEFEGLQYFHVDNVTDISAMFGYCEALTADQLKGILSKFDFSKITDMSNLFVGCTFESFDFSGITNFNTQNVTDMSLMFCNCKQLQNIDLTGLDTRSVTSMHMMFSGCESLVSINVGMFNTAKVEDMEFMFNNCKNLTTISGLDADNFNTSNVTKMGYMFSYCNNLTSFDVSGLETNSVTDMSDMFKNCSSITNLNLSNFVTNSVKSITGLFQGCSSLTTLDISNFNTENVTSSSNIFTGCSSLKEIDLRSFSKMDGYNAFNGCSSLTTLKLPDNGIVIEHNLCGMFQNCSSIEYIDFSRFNIVEYRDDIQMFYTFKNCSKLINVDLTSFDGAEVTVVPNLFDGCSNLASVLVPDNWIVPTKYNAYSYSYYDENGTYISIPYSDVNVFDGCTQIIGDKGTRYSSEHIKYDYADIDGGESSPAYFTTGKYKVFYVNTEGATFASNNPKEFDKNLSSDIAIVNPEKKGYVFLGWTGTIASGISATEPTKNVTIAKGSVGNRIYTANWQQRISAEVNDKVSFPIDMDLYCKGQEKTITLPFTITYGTATGFKLSFDDNSFPTIVGKVNADNTISINVPEDIKTGIYKCSLVFTGNSDPESEPYPLEITANIAYNSALQVYTDVLIANNHDEEFSAYQWYKDGNPISNATLQFYSEPSFNGSYTVKITTKDGNEFMSCPIIIGTTTKELKSSVNVFPNPAKSGEYFSVEILEYNPSQIYDVLIFTANGMLVKEISNVEKSFSLALPSGVYSGSLITNGTKTSFKFIVE